MNEDLLGVRPNRHGMTGHPALSSYKGAKARTTRRKHRNWAEYGGRGIKFLLPPFSEFWSVMGPTWFKGATLERIDNDGHYEIGNVRWATRKEQCLNTRNSRLLTYQGVTKNLSLWAEDLGIDKTTLGERVSKWGVERALSTPRMNPHAKKLIEFEGRSLSVKEWAAEAGGVHGQHA